MEKIFTKIETPYKNTEFDAVLMGTCLLTCRLSHLARRPGARITTFQSRCVTEDQHGRELGLEELPGHRELRTFLLLLAGPSIQGLGPWPSRTATLWCSPDAKRSLFEFSVEQIQVTLSLVQATSGLQSW